MQIHGSPSVSIALLSVSIALLRSNRIILPDDSYVLGGEYVGRRSLKGKPVIVRGTRRIVADFVRALNEATEVKMCPDDFDIDWI
jgi:hypothetical protein